jgi:hypothetical protein
MYYYKTPLAGSGLCGTRIESYLISPPTIRSSISSHPIPSSAVSQPLPARKQSEADGKGGGSTR